MEYLFARAIRCKWKVKPHFNYILNQYVIKRKMKHGKYKSLSFPGPPSVQSTTATYASSQITYIRFWSKNHNATCKSKCSVEEVTYDLCNSQWNTKIMVVYSFSETALPERLNCSQSMHWTCFHFAIVNNLAFQNPLHP